MTKQEFNERLRVVPSRFIRRNVTNEEYEVIEKVYNFHPSISETDGKDQIAFLYNTFGMRIIRDMLPTAEEAAKLENEIRATRVRLSSLQTRYDELKD